MKFLVHSTALKEVRLKIVRLHELKIIYYKRRKEIALNINMNYQEAFNMYNALGADGFIKYFNNIYKFGLYSMSTYWLEDSHYICKLKGARGDLLIAWNL